MNANIAPLKAEEALERHGGRMNPDALATAIELATGDKSQASRARAERALAIERAKTATMET